MPYYPPSTGGGGGGLTAVPYAATRVTTADITLGTGGTWAAVDGTGALDLVIAAATGDHIVLLASFLSNGGFTAGSSGLDIATLVSAAPVTYLSSKTGTPAANGLQSLYTDPSFIIGGGLISYTVAAGDIAAGNVTFRLMYNNTTAARKIFASTNYPFDWCAINLKH
jgi:hypothetical protein